MINTKVFCLESSDGTSLQLGIIETFKDEDSLLFTWESSLMMSAYIMSNKELFANTNILEIGAGDSITSMLDSKHHTHRHIAPHDLTIHSKIFIDCYTITSKLHRSGSSITDMWPLGHPSQARGHIREMRRAGHPPNSRTAHYPQWIGGCVLRQTSLLGPASYLAARQFRLHIGLGINVYIYSVCLSASLPLHSTSIILH